MKIKYFEKPCGVEYLRVDGYELNVHELIHIFKELKQNNKIHTTEKSGITLSNLMKLNLIDADGETLGRFESDAMEILENVWMRDHDKMCTGSD